MKCVQSIVFYSPLIRCIETSFYYFKMQETSQKYSESFFFRVILVLKQLIK